MSSRQLIPVIALAVVGVACQRPAKPATVVPPSPNVISFSASASSVAPGTNVTLGWRVENATSISLVEASTGPVEGVASDAFDSIATVKVTTSSVFILTARGEAGTDTRLVNVLVPDTAATVVFRALPDTIAGGEASTLVWSAPGFGNVTIQDATGATIDLKGQLESGSVQVRPAASTSYTLTAGGKRYTVPVTVKPNIVRFTASTLQANPSDAVTFEWTTGGASKLTLSAAGRGELFTTTDLTKVHEGSFTDTLPATLPVGGVAVYTLTAEQNGELANQTVIVNVGSDVVIETFSVPEAGRPNGVTQVTWLTTNAAMTEVLIDNAVRFQSTSAEQAHAGQYSFTTPGEDFVVTLRATDARGATVTRSESVDVLGLPGLPTVQLSTSSVSLGAPVTITFTAPNSRLTRVVNDLGRTIYSARGAAAEGGTATAYPTLSTRYTVIGDNTVGDPTRSVTSGLVTVSGTQPRLSFVGTGTPVHNGTAELTYAADPTALLFGVPHTNVQSASSANFIDIRSTGRKLVIGAEDDVVRFDPGFDTLLFGKVATGTISVSTNGWMAFNTLYDALSGDKTIASDDTPMLLLAPYWDDLKLTADGGIYWQIIGDAPEATLIVQWDSLMYEPSSTVPSLFTFEVQIAQTGAVSFQYETMQYQSTSPSFTIGIKGSTLTSGIEWPTTVPSNTALYFFSPVSSPVSTLVFAGVEYGGFVKSGDAYLQLTGPTAFRLEDVRISEVNYDPKPGVPAGEWIEVQNRSELPLDLTGWRLLTTDAGTTLDGGTVPPFGMLVIGQSADPAMNDGANVGLVYGPEFALPNRNAFVRIEARTDAGATLAYDGGTLSLATYDAGVAYAVDQGPYRTNTGTTNSILWCGIPSTTYGAMSQKGTPGTWHTCDFGYSLHSISGSFFDISTTGTSVFAAGPVDDDIATLSLPSPGPKYFAQEQSSVTVSANGFLSFTPFTAVGTTNKSSPNSTAPLSTVAVFWDNMKSLGVQGSGVFYKRVAPGEDLRNPGGHWIFQWNHLTTTSAASSTSGGPDDLTFQVKFFDTGVIEYHYATMVSGTSLLYGDGSGATIWLENTANRALIVGVSQPVVASHAGFRFVPR